MWRDDNSNGYTDPGELVALGVVNVVQIKLSYVDGRGTDAQFNDHRFRALYTLGDGKTRDIENIWFNTDKSKSIQTTIVDIPNDVAMLPVLDGMGIQYDLQQAIVRDASGNMKKLALRLLAANDTAEREVLLKDLLAHWTGQQTVSRNSRGIFVDARDVATYEAFTGTAFLTEAMDPLASRKPSLEAGTLFKEEYARIFERFYGQLAAQTFLKPLFDQIVLSRDLATNEWKADLLPVATAINAKLAASPNESAAELLEFVRALGGSPPARTFNFDEFRNALSIQSSDLLARLDLAWAHSALMSIQHTIEAGATNDRVVGASKDDFLSGGAGNDTILGYYGADQIYGDDGNDVLDGGAGNDALEGGRGNDLYLFNRGSGRDVICEGDQSLGYVDTLRFGAGIVPDDVHFWRDSSTLFLGVSNSTDIVELVCWFSDAARIERVEFADSTLWTPQHFLAAFALPTAGNDFLSITSNDGTLAGLAGNDELKGGPGQDLLDGGIGNDSLVGGAGRDTLVGGIGTDLLEGGSGNDLYIFNRGDGSDTIDDHDDAASNIDTLRFGEGIAPSDITIETKIGTLILSLAGTADHVDIQSWSYPSSQIERIEFSDGTVWNSEQLHEAASKPGNGMNYLIGTDRDDVLAGLDGNDTLVGGIGDDTLEGGAGNDVLDGGPGNDIYLFKRGDGADAIGNSGFTASNVDVLRFGSGIDPGDIQVTRSSFNDITLIVTGSNDSLRLFNWYSDWKAIGQIEFANGTVWYEQDITAATLIANDEANYLLGTGNSATMRGLGGNDTICGTLGNDVLEGGVGDDQLQGSGGNDIFLYQRGDGQDTIFNNGFPGDFDTIRFAAGILPEDVNIVATLDGSLILILGDGADRITVAPTPDSERGIAGVQFHDGSQWGSEEIERRITRTSAPNLSGVGTTEQFSELATNHSATGLTEQVRGLTQVIGTFNAEQLDAPILSGHFFDGSDTWQLDSNKVDSMLFAIRNYVEQPPDRMALDLASPAQLFAHGRLEQPSTMQLFDRSA